MYVYSLIQFTLSPIHAQIHIILASLAMVFVWCMLVNCNYYSKRSGSGIMSVLSLVHSPYFPSHVRSEGKYGR